MSVPKIVVLGAGYGSLMTVKELQKQLHYNEAEVILVNPNPYHYVTTKLHEPAAGTTSHASAQIELSTILNTQKVNFIQDRVSKIDVENKKVYLEKEAPFSYNYVVIGLGSSPETFGIKGMKENAFFIRNIDSVCLIRKHIEYMFSLYKESGNEEYLTLIVGGAGFTGIEYIGELVERVPSLCKELDIPKEKVRIVNIEAMPSILPGFDQELVDYAKKYLEEQGVEFILSTPIEECTKEGVKLKGGEEVRAKTVVWTGGIRGNQILEETSLETMRGRVKVDAFLRAPGNEDVFVIGDCSLIFNEENKPYPPTAQMATAQGQYLGEYLLKVMRGGEVKPFVFAPKGTVASLGRREAVGFIGSKKVVGGSASLLKKLIDLRWLYLLGGIPLVVKKGKSYI